MQVLIVTVLLSIVIPPLNAANEELPGKIWYGVMDVGEREFRFRIEPVPDTDVPMVHQLVSLDEGKRVFRLDAFQLNDSLLQFELKQTAAAYSGILSADGIVSTGSFSTATSEDFARDVEATFDVLLKDPRIRKNGIGLIGHSEGGIIAPIVAARRNDVAFAILLAGPGVNGREILLSQGQLILRAEGIQDDISLNTQLETQRAMIDTITDSPDGATREELIAAAMLHLSKVLSPEALQEEQFKAGVSAGIDQMSSPWFRLFLTHEPGPVLEKVNCPVLALNGEKDVQVDPRLNLPAVRNALEKGGNTKFEAVEFPGLNHLFQSCSTGGVSEYQTIEETVSPVALKKIAEWILQNSPDRLPNDSSE